MLELRNKSIPVKVHYIFTITDWTNPENIEGKTYDKDAVRITELRKREEEIVSAKLRHQYVTHDFIDLPLRIQNEEEQLLMANQIKSRLQELISKENDTLLFPLGLVHPDHVAIREIGVELLCKGFEVFFFEDMPYVSFAGYNYHYLYSQVSHRGFEPQTVAINIHEKIYASKLYSSQVCNRWLKDMNMYAYDVKDNNYYERIWRPKNQKLDFV